MLRFDFAEYFEFVETVCFCCLLLIVGALVTIRNNECKIVMWIQGKPETKVEHDVVQYYYSRLVILVLGFVAMVICLCRHGLMSCRCSGRDYRLVFKTKNVSTNIQVQFYQDSSIIILLVCFLLCFTSPMLLLGPGYSTSESGMKLAGAFWYVLEALYAILPIVGIFVDLFFGHLLLNKLGEKEDDNVPLAEVISTL